MLCRGDEGGRGREREKENMREDENGKVEGDEEGRKREKGENI